jgi:single-strand DNA-binding protein
MKLLGLARIGNEPELRYSSSGMAVLQLSLAYNYSKEKKSQWVRASLFGKRAESLAPYLAKGQLIYAEISDVHLNEFTSKNGNAGVSLEGIVQDVGLTGKSDVQDKPAQQPSAPKPAPKQELADLSDDIPFN